MAAYVFDSSAVVKRYMRETGTAWVLSLTEPGAGHAIYVAGITGVEVVSALTRQTRSGALSPTAAATALVGAAARCRTHPARSRCHCKVWSAVRHARHAAAQAAESTSACSSTVRVV